MRKTLQVFAPFVSSLLLLPGVPLRHQTSDALLMAEGSGVAAQSVFTGVKVRFAGDKDHLLVNKGADLVLDDSAHRLIVKSSDCPLNIGYEAVEKVIVELNTYPHKPGLGASLLGAMVGGWLFGGAIATSIDKPLDNDHFIYLEYKKADGTRASLLMSVDRAAVPMVLKVIRGAFGDRVAVPAFQEKAERSDMDQATPLERTALRVKATAREHPLPELRSDKALVVVACPATFYTQTKPERSEFGSLILAGNVLVGHNASGTYTFFYLDPGEYFLAASGPSAKRVLHLQGMHIKLEAGKDYYLTESVYEEGGYIKAFLARHSKELVMYEVAGSLWSDWTRPEKEQSEKK